jgi:putative Ca2+/H+ antiporter (TMEM165/GDT1 family)
MNTNINNNENFLNNSPYTISNTPNSKNILSQFFYLSLFETFFFVFMGEIGDQTFLYMMILKIKSNNSNGVFFSSLISYLIIILIGTGIGAFLNYLLYQNFIDLLSMFIFTMSGINQFLRFFEPRENHTYEDEIYECMHEEIQEKKLIKKVTKSQIRLIKMSSRKKSRDNFKEPLLDDDLDNKEIIDDDNENMQNNFIVWKFVKSIFIDEFLDRVHIGIIASSCVLNIKGVLIGSLLGSFAVIYLACFKGEYLASKIKGRIMGIFNGFIFLLMVMEIFYYNKDFTLKV